MKYLSYIIGAVILALSYPFYSEYLVSNYDAFFHGHKYYFNMLSSSTNWYIVLFGLLFAFFPVIYIILKRNKFTWFGLGTTILVSFFAFMLLLGINKGGFVSLGFFIEIINYLIIFSYYIIILLGSLSLGNIILKKLHFNEAIYNFAIKFGLGFGILGVITYYLNILSVLNVGVSYLLFFILFAFIVYQRDFLKNIGKQLLENLEEFNGKIEKLGYLKYLYYIIFALVFFYIFVGFNYTFIPYPTAWDANHAYMFYPKVLAQYGGYPWWTDFRPALSLWTSILSWVYNLGFWTWFSQDTWMITFNFVSAILALFFSFMLVNILTKVLRIPEKKEFLIKALGYILFIAWFTSGMGAFLVFVDNKTDLAVFMYVALALFLLVYTFYRFKNDSIEDRKLDLLFLALSGVFFAFANTIKPTATFDFFESIIVYSFLNIGVLIVVGAVLFVAGFLAYLNFRGFDKAVSSQNSYILMISGFIVSGIDLVLGWIKDKIKIIGIFVIVGSFIGTLILTKGIFGLAQIAHGEKINTKTGKIVESMLAGSGLPIVKKDELTGSLYTGLKKEIGSAYNEDNTRYVGYGSLNFGSPWWSFIVPSTYKTKYCVIFDKSKNIDCKNKLYIWENTEKGKEARKAVLKDIFSNLNDSVIDNMVKYQIKTYETNGKVNDIMKQLNINPDLPEFKKKKELKEKLYKVLLNKIKSGLNKAIYNGTLTKELQKDIFKNKDILIKKYENTYILENVSIPYRKLIPFNVVFNWSLQNESSYYTDIGIIWIFLVFVVIIALICSLGKLGYYLYKTKLSYENSKIENKNEESIQEYQEKKLFIEKQIYDYKLLFAFSIATLTGWTIWLFVAEGIVWYNVGGIIWLIITSLIFTSKNKDKGFLAYVLIFIAFIGIFLNLFRIASQGGGQIQTWYKSSIGKEYTYIQDEQGYKPKEEIKIPYTFDDVFNLQFSMYNKAINGFNKRNNNERGIIGGTYIKYFIKNQNKIKDDQFLMYLWKLGSDDNIDNFYARLKDQGIKDIVLDPNIASVVMGTGNIALWYRYYGKVDKNGNLIEKGVFPHFVDLAQDGKLEYGYTNNLGIKYALIYSDQDLAKILNEKDLNKVRKIRYELIALKYLARNIGFEYPNSPMPANLQRDGFVALQKIIIYRLTNGNPMDILSDLADIYAFNVKDYKLLLSKGQTDFKSLSNNEKKLFLQFISTYNIVRQSKQNPAILQNAINPIMQQTLQSRAQLFYVKVK